MKREENNRIKKMIEPNKQSKHFEQLLVPSIIGSDSELISEQYIRNRVDKIREEYDEELHEELELDGEDTLSRVSGKHATRWFRRFCRLCYLLVVLS